MRIHFVLLISFVISLSGLSKAQIKPSGQMFPLATLTLELFRRALENARYSHPVIFSPAMNNVLRLLSHGARGETRAEIDELLSQPQQESSSEVASAATRFRPRGYRGGILVASGQSIQRNHFFEAPASIGSVPVDWESHNLEEPDKWGDPFHRFRLSLSEFSDNHLIRFIDCNTLEHADNSFLQIIGVARIDRSLHSIFEELRNCPETTFRFVVIHALRELMDKLMGNTEIPGQFLTSVSTSELPQILASEHQRDFLVRNSGIVSHLDFTERLRSLMPTAFSPRADFGRLLTLGNQQASLRSVVMDNYFSANDEAASLISITKYIFQISPVTAHVVPGNPPSGPVQRPDQNQSVRESTLVAELDAQRPHASDMLPRLFGTHHTTPDCPDSDHQLHLGEDGSFRMIHGYEATVSGTWKLVPCDNPSQYRIHFSNIQNNSHLLPDHEFEDISVNFKWVDRITVMGGVNAKSVFEETAGHEIYTYYSSIVFEQNPVEMVYLQYPNALRDDRNKDKKTFYPSSAQVRGLCQFNPKDLCTYKDHRPLL